MTVDENTSVVTHEHDVLKPVVDDFSRHDFKGAGKLLEDAALRHKGQHYFNIAARKSIEFMKANDPVSALHTARAIDAIKNTGSHDIGYGDYMRFLLGIRKQIHIPRL